MGDKVKLDNIPAWEQYASWWEGEAQRVRQQYAVDEATLTRAGEMFGSGWRETLGAEMQATLRARHEFGERMAAHAADIAAHVRENLRQYQDTEAANQRALST
jgi:hypothetical protein